MNPNTLLLTVDLGTSFIKTSIYDADSNALVSANEPVRSDCPVPGTFLQKGDDIFQSVISCIRKVVSGVENARGRIEAVSFTGQMSGFMGVDRDWNDVTTWSCSMDTRYMPYANRQLKELTREFLEISGTNAPQMASKFEWFKTEFPEESKKIAKYVMISGYVIGRMGSGPVEDAAMDRSYASWTGLADIRRGGWSDVICDAVKMDRNRLPAIVAGNHICGALSSSAAEATGLRSGIPLVAGAGDKVAGCLGAGIVKPGDAILEASSYGAISVCVDEFRIDNVERRYDILPSAVDGLYYAVNFIIGSGMSLDWFIKTSDADFREMDAKVAALAPGSDGVMALGHLGGGGMPLDGNLKGLWMGFDWSHRQEHFYRALLESYSYDFKLTMDSIESLYPQYAIDRVCMIGGGAKSAVWPQMNADVMNKPYLKLNRGDVAMWGAAILAGNAVGLYPDIVKTALDKVAVKETHSPDKAMHERYRPYAELYGRFLKEFSPAFSRLRDLYTEDRVKFGFSIP